VIEQSVAPPPEAEPGPPLAPRRIPESPVRVAWHALWTSRIVVLAAGILGALSFGGGALGSSAYDPSRLTMPFGYFGNLLVSPLARWDSVWYLQIAQSGYDHVQSRTTFFPLYPLMVRAVGFVIRSDLIAGVLISLVCFGVALTVLFKLVALELGDERARICVILVAFFPMAYYFSAVYTESLFLALSIGCVYQARLGRWASAGVLGALAAASRNSGIVLVVPIVLLYLYGPRADRPPALARARGALDRLKPRYPISPSVAWVLLVPVGLGAYLLFLAISTGHALSPFTQEKLWFHHFDGPFGGVWDGIVAAWGALRQLIHGSQSPAYFAPAGGGFPEAGQNLMLFGFLVGGAIALVGAFRRLPFAYPAYALASLALPLSSPVTFEPLRSLPRYEAVLFPLFMWGAAWVHRRRLELKAVGCFAVLLGLFTAEFAAWRFVA
jgi:hypothetical protein